MNIADLFVRVRGDTSDVTQKLSGVQKSLSGLEGSMGSAHLKAGRLGNAFEALTSRIAGVHPVVGKLAVVLSEFAIGSGVTVGILAGVTAVAVVYDRLTESARAAAKAQDEALKSGMAAFQLRALGPAGQSANVATAAADRLAELQRQRDHIRDLTSTDRKLFESPEAATRRIDQEMGQLRNLLKYTEMVINVARVKQFAESITTPFEFAASRGQDILHFYGEAQSAQKQLNALAKSGNLETRQAALQGLQQIDALLDKIKLQTMGLAEAPKTLLGLPSSVAVAGLGATLSNLSSAAAAPGASISSFRDQIFALGDLLSEASRQATGSDKTKIDAFYLQVQTLADAVRLAAAAPGDREGVAASIRFQHRTAPDRYLSNAAAQAQYSEQLATRENALKLPDVFDAVREAAVRMGESLRQVNQDLAVILQSFKSLAGALADLNLGIRRSLVNFLDQLRPGSIAGRFLDNAAQQITSAIDAWIQTILYVGGKGAGSQLGGSFGAVAGAALGTRIGAGVGGVLGSVLPGVGTVVGTVLGSAIGGLFDHHKKAVDNNTAAVNANTQALLLNAPRGFNVDALRSLGATSRRYASRGGVPILTVGT